MREGLRRQDYSGIGPSCSDNVTESRTANAPPCRYSSRGQIRRATQDDGKRAQELADVGWRWHALMRFLVKLPEIWHV